MTFTTKTALLAALIIPGFAFAQVNVGDQAGTDEAAIRAYLASQGYDVQETEREDGMIEVEAVLDGTEFEFTIATDTGEIVEIELEDEGANDDEDDDG